MQWSSHHMHDAWNHMLDACWSTVDFCRDPSVVANGAGCAQQQNQWCHRDVGWMQKAEFILPQSPQSTTWHVWIRAAIRQWHPAVAEAQQLENLELRTELTNRDSES